MKKQIILFTALLLTLSYSCKNENKESAEVKTQMEEVIAVHDEVMPKMGTIGRLISEIDAKIKDTDSTEALIKASQDLKNANKTMMDWMKDFGDHFDSDEIMDGKALTEEKQKILDLEETKIKALRDKMNSSIANAKKLLE